MLLGAELWSAVAESRGVWGEDEKAAEVLLQEIVDLANERLGEVRRERNGLARAVESLGAANFIALAHLERGASAPRPAVTAKLVDALGWLTAATAVTER